MTGGHALGGFGVLLILLGVVCDMMDKIISPFLSIRLLTCGLLYELNVDFLRGNYLVKSISYGICPRIVSGSFWARSRLH